jgi:hypothetical protein
MRLKLAVLVTLTSLATAQQKTKKLSPEFSKAAFKAVLAVINNPAGAVLDVTRMKDALENVGVAASIKEEKEAVKAIQNLNAKCGVSANRTPSWQNSIPRACQRATSSDQRNARTVAGNQRGNREGLAGRIARGQEDYFTIFPRAPLRPAPL